MRLGLGFSNAALGGVQRDVWEQIGAKSDLVDTHLGVAESPERDSAPEVKGFRPIHASTHLSRIRRLRGIGTKVTLKAQIAVLKVDRAWSHGGR